MTAMATLVVPTRNRRDDLRRLLASAARQTVPLDVIVLDDGSTDGTGDMVRTEFPQARYEHVVEPRGPTYQRNRGAALARHAIVLAVDDDATFESPHTAAQALAAFDEPRVAVAALPYVNVNFDAAIRQRPPRPDGCWVHFAFVAVACAFRRDAFQAVGGYSEDYFYNQEESDLCLRLLERGYVTRLVAADPLHHHKQRQRDRTRLDFYAGRNGILFGMKNVPLPELALHLPGSTFNVLRVAARSGRWRHSLAGLAAGWGSCLAWRARRAPVSRRAYRLFRDLKATGPRELRQVEARLNPLAVPAIAAGG